ncbi:MAG: NADP-dependent oxidoreductase [Frankiaceae bacterium]
MKALAISGRGEAPEVVDVADAAAPAPGEVRVAVEAASVNGFDIGVAAGRFWDVMPHEFPVVLGRDYVGTIDAIGEGVEGLQVGDRVAGVVVAPGLGRGSLGERVTSGASAVAHVPDGMSVEDAAAVGLAAVTALDAVDALAVSEGDVVLVSGATGGVGLFAVQLAAARGARVIATARPGTGEELLRSLGAGEVVDYAGNLPAAVRAVAPDGVTKALHAAGDPAALAATLRPGGQLASLLGAGPEQVGRSDVTVSSLFAQASRDKLAGLLARVADGRLRVHVSTTVPLDRATEALTAFGGGKLGKVLVTG